MANPNSALTRVRLRLVRWLDPYPDKGEAWCMGCALNGGRTLILNANGHAAHVALHQDDQGLTTTAVAMRVNWGYVPAEDP